jgi:hypothetical protein
MLLKNVFCAMMQFRMKESEIGIRKCDKISISKWWINSKINILVTWPLESWTQYSPSCLPLLSTCRVVAPYFLFALVHVSSKPSCDPIILLAHRPIEPSRAQSMLRRRTRLQWPTQPPHSSWWTNTWHGGIWTIYSPKCQVRASD